MLLDFDALVQKYQMKITGLLHLGAHLGEEAESYHRLGIPNVWWVEANPDVMNKLRRNVRKFGQHLIQALVTDETGQQVPFNVTNYDGMSSSIYQFGQLHLDSSPDTVFVDTITLPTTTVDVLVAANGITDCNTLVADLQGAEYLAFKGASNFLKTVDYLYCEVNEGQVYQGIHELPDLRKLLSDFTLVEKKMTPAKWGDGLFVRSSLL